MVSFSSLCFPSSFLFLTTLFQNRAGEAFEKKNKKKKSAQVFLSPGHTLSHSLVLTSTIQHITHVNIQRTSRRPKPFLGIPLHEVGEDVNPPNQELVIFSSFLFFVLFLIVLYILLYSPFSSFSFSQQNRGFYSE